MKKTVLSILVAAVAVMTSGADTLLFAQNGQGPDNTWSNAANWFSALHVPTTNDTARILGDTAWKPCFVTAPGAEARTVELGLFGHGGVLTINSNGTLDVSQSITIGQSLPAAGRENLLVNNGVLAVDGQGKLDQGVSTFVNNGTATFNDPVNSFVMQPTEFGVVTNNGEFYGAASVYASHSGNAVFINETSGIFTNGNTVIMGQNTAATGLLVNKGSFTTGNTLYMNKGDQILVNEGTMILPKLICQGDASSSVITNSGTLTVSGDINLPVAGTTVFNMEDGTVTAAVLDMRPGGAGDAWTNNSCHINLNGGTIEVGNLALDGSKLANSTIDVTDGVLIRLNADVSGTWNWVTGQGAFTAFGGDGNVIIEYDGTNTILRGELPAFPALSPTALGPNLIANGGFEDVSDLVGTPSANNLYNITNSFGDFGPFNGLTAAIDSWEYTYADPSNMTTRLGNVRHLDEGGIDILDGTFYVDAFVDADDDHLNFNSVMNFRHGVKQVDILNGVTVDAGAVYQFAVNAAAHSGNYSHEAGTLTGVLTDGSGTPIVGGTVTDTLDAWNGLKGLTLSGDMLNDGQVDVIVDVVGTNDIPGYPTASTSNNIGSIVSKVLIYEVTLNEVREPQENDLNRDGIFDYADVVTAQAYLDGSIDGGADAATRQANRIDQGMTPTEALADLNLTEFDTNGDGTFDAADVALLESMIPLIIESGVMNGSGHFEVEVSGLKIGTEYFLMKDTDLVSAPGFVEVDSLTAASGTETLVDTNAAAQAFYKVTD